MFFAAPLPLRDGMTARLKNCKTETHAVSCFTTFRLSSWCECSVARTNQIEIAQEGTERIMNVEILKKFYVNKFRFKLGCGITALALTAGIAAAQTEPSRSVL